MDQTTFLPAPSLSAIPGLIHGFGRRLAGSRAHARAAVREHFRESGQVFFLRQVHGCAVASPPWTDAPEADASLTAHRGTLLAIETADCLPVLIVDPVGRRVAAAHAGWRGTAAGVVHETVRALASQGSRPEGLIAALGPAIGPCCYEVGREVEEAFGPARSKFFVPGSAGRKHLDLVAANRAQLLETGLDPGRIEAVVLCTRCRPDLFFSYRRDGAQAGRMISVVGFSRSGPTASGLPA